MLRTRPVLVASALAAILLGGALGHAWIAPDPPVPADTHSDTAADAAPPGAGALPPRPALTLPTPVARPAVVAPRTDSLADRVDRLSRSDDPLDAFAAYQLVTRCLWARDQEGWMARHIAPGDRTLLPTTAQACGDIASDQVQSRLQWLQRAALAGVHHAAAELLKEGPDGLGVSGSSDPDAPENAAWKDRVEAAIEAGVHTCDPESLDYRAGAYQAGLGVPPDRAKALTYWVAYVDCRRRLASTQPVLSDGDSVTQRMGAALTADEIATAVAAGQKLARDAQPLAGDR